MWAKRIKKIENNEKLTISLSEKPSLKHFCPIKVKGIILNCK